MTGLLSQYLGYGNDSLKPNPPSVLPGVLALYWAEDTEKMYWWNHDDAEWGETGGLVDAPSDGNLYVRKDGLWLEIPEFPPNDGQQYVIQDGEWVLVDIPDDVGLEDAPSDGNLYARKDGAWESFEPGSGGGGGSGGGPFNGARVHLTADASGVIGERDLINVANAVDFDTNSWWDDANNQFVVPADVTHVMAFSSVVVDTDTFIGLRWYKNGIIAAVIDIDGRKFLQCNTGVIEVEEGDTLRPALYTPTSHYQTDEDSMTWASVIDVSHMAGGGGGGGVKSEYGTMDLTLADCPVVQELGTVVTVESELGLHFKLTTSGGQRGLFRGAATPPNNFCVTARVNGFAVNIDEMGWGIAIRAADGKLLTNYYYPSGDQCAFQRWNSPTSYASGIAGSANTRFMRGPAWMALGVDSDGVVTAYMSGDGINWLPMQYTNDVDDWLGTPTGAGIHLFGSTTNGQQCSGALYYLRIEAGTAFPSPVFAT